MSFIEYYILFSLIAVTLLSTFSLPQLFDKNYEKIGLGLLYIILISSIIFNINKWNLLWVSPIALIIPFYITKIIKMISFRKINFLIRLSKLIF